MDGEPKKMKDDEKKTRSNGTVPADSIIILNGYEKEIF